MTPGWLLGPAPDLLFGCGLLYAAWVVGLALSGVDMGALGPWLPLLILLTGMPHYGATLLRIYPRPEARRRYARAAFHGTAAIVGAFLLGLHSPRAGALLITLYLTLSPWHYASQNYGLTLLFLRRRQVAVPEPVRRLLRASFALSYLLVFVSYHRAGSGGGSDPLYAAGAAYRFVPLGLPDRLVQGILPVLLLLYALSLLLALRPLLRHGARRLAPAFLLLSTQAVWFAILTLLGHPRFGAGLQQHAALAFVWVALGHCVQYLWICLYHARCSGQAGPGPLSAAGYLAKVTLLGAALWVVPALLCAPGGLFQGRLPFESGLGLLVAAAVNLHHFLLDSAIWKLRDPGVGRLLTDARPLAGPDARPVRSGPPSLAACSLAAIGGLSALAWLVAAWESEVGHRRAWAARDLPRLEQAAVRLAAVGRDGPRIYVALGRLHEARRDWAAARAAYQRALLLDPDHPAARRRLQSLSENGVKLVRSSK